MLKGNPLLLSDFSTARDVPRVLLHFNKQPGCRAPVEMTGGWATSHVFSFASTNSLDVALRSK